MKRRKGMHWSMAWVLLRGGALTMIQELETGIITRAIEDVSYSERVEAALKMLLWGYAITQPLYVAAWTRLTARRHLHSSFWKFYSGWWITLFSPFLAMVANIVEAMKYDSSTRFTGIITMVPALLVVFVVSIGLHKWIVSRMEQKLIDEAYEEQQAEQVND